MLLKLLFINFLTWKLYKQLKDEVDKLQYIRQGLLNDIAALKYKISILDKTPFSIEQDYKRKEH